MARGLPSAQLFSLMYAIDPTLPKILPLPIVARLEGGVKAGLIAVRSDEI